MIMKEQNFYELVNIMRRLREECPWDKEQTNDSIKAATLEEAYEAVEAIDKKNYDELKSELGDLLLHIVFHSAIAEDNKLFNIEDVIKSISEKLIRRHPHVFSDTVVTNNNDILRNWEHIKLQEGRKSLLEGIPKALPALYRAYRIQEKAAKVGFDWSDIKDVWEKVKEEFKEFREAELSGDIDKTEEEFGDLLFALINYARFIKINPENALRKTNEKFISRFQYIEQKLEENGKSLIDSNLEEMDKYWEEAKTKL
jgi:tetrapyrrole methylase family protein/MazG family protein